LTGKEADLDRRLEMTEITGGELFAQALQAEGIEFLFGPLLRGLLPTGEAGDLVAGSQWQ
jgi:hypothetical protein